MLQFFRLIGLLPEVTVVVPEEPTGPSNAVTPASRRIFLDKGLTREVSV